MKRNEPRSPDPVALLLDLTDGCISQLSAPAWKVVSYVARHNIAVYLHEVRAANDPGRMLLRDAASAVPVLKEFAKEEIARIDKVDEAPPGSAALHLVGGPKNRQRWPTFMSLQQISTGRLPDGTQRDRGAGLSKSTATKAINEAIRLGVLERRKRQSEAKGCISSEYAINWEKVLELAGEFKRKSRRRRLRRGSPIDGRPTPVHKMGSSPTHPN
jgi:hypothetical protein